MFNQFRLLPKIRLINIWMINYDNIKNVHDHCWYLLIIWVFNSFLQNLNQPMNYLNI